MTLQAYAGRIARAKNAVREERVPYGPWKGSMRSVPADRVPIEFMVAGNNYLYLPRSGYWKRRNGQTQVFDSFASPVGMLPAKWTTNGAKGRQLEEFTSPEISDDIPTMCALTTRETVATGLDDGPFSNFWIRDQVLDINYTMGSEFDITSTYPVPGSSQSYKYIPLWYKSGDGGLTRGTSEFARRFFMAWSRRFLKVGRWHYFPSLKATPSRWLGSPESVVGVFGRPGANVSANMLGTPNTGVNTYLNVSDNPDLTSSYNYIDAPGQAAFPNTPFGDSYTGATFTADSPRTGWKLKATLGLFTNSGTTRDWEYRMRVTLNAAGAYADAANSGFVSIQGLAGYAIDTFLNVEFALSGAEMALIDPADYRIIIDFRYSGGAFADTSPRASNFKLEVDAGSGSVGATRLLPSGPFQPTHAGVITRGDTIETNSTFYYPDADVTDGGWLKSSDGTNTDLYTMIDEVTVDDADYIKCPAAGAACVIGIGNLGFTPASDDTVKLHVRAKVVSGSGTISYELRELAVTIASQATVIFDFFTDLSITLSAAQIASVTNWDDIRLYVNNGAAVEMQVSASKVEHLASAGEQTQGGWRGSDRFYYSVAYKFEDDSIWMPCTPRGPNDQVTAGFNLFTVNASNFTAGYEKLTWTHIPIGPYGTKSRFLLRSLKIDASIESTLALNPRDLKVVWEIQDNVTTSYEDFFADDDALQFDINDLFIRDDHIMPPRARYIFGGDTRVCHSYGGFNPAAVVLAPVGRATDYDLNSPDDTAALFNQNSQYMRLELDSSGVGTLRLTESDGTTALDTTFALATYNTLEKLVDAINATTCTNASPNNKQWRAQICPGANPQAVPATYLTPHHRTIASCVVTNTSNELTKAAGGLSKVAVGAIITKTGVPAGTHVLRIDSDTKLIMSANATSTSTSDVIFTFDLGDSPTSGTTVRDGYQRVISNSLPGFLYFNSAYLDQFPIEKNAVWMTVADPGSIKSAANCFAARAANKHLPPLEAGISMGGFAVDNGFVVPFSLKNAAIRNTRDTGSGVDSDYKLFIINETRGCCAWQTVVPGGRFGLLGTPDGLVAADLYNEILISPDVFQHTPTARGDWDYEIPKCIAATGMDDDTAYWIAEIARGMIFVNYRDSVSDARPSRQVIYDFSSGKESNGLAALVRGSGDRWPGSLWGWSNELVRAVTAMSEGRSSDGVHVYGWNDANAGSTGDGRIDELETSDTDNGTAISASITAPWLRFPTKLAAQEALLEHSSPSGATVAFDWHRSLNDETYTLTPSTGSLIYQRDLKMLTTPARAATPAGYWGWRQTVGGAGEIRAITLKVFVLPSFN